MNRVSKQPVILLVGFMISSCLLTSNRVEAKESTVIFENRSGEVALVKL